MMPDEIVTLRQQLSGLRDDGLDFFARIDGLVGDESGSRSTGTDVQVSLPPDDQARAEDLRRRAGRLMDKIAALVEGSALLGDADLRDLSQNAKRMRAALRFRRYQYWDLYVHHDEDVVLGVSPSSQSEDQPLSPDNARAIFLEAYNATAEMFDLISTTAPEVLGQVERGQGLLSYRKNTAFIMMWISRDHPELDDVRDTVKEVFKSHDITAIRADEIEHEGVITDRIISEITGSEFLFADLTGQRPSVYYEVGYAHAIGKRVILFRKKGAQIHFDLAGRNCPEYENLGDLRRKLEKRLNAMMGTETTEA